MVFLRFDHAHKGSWVIHLFDYFMGFLWFFAQIRTNMPKSINKLHKLKQFKVSRDFLYLKPHVTPLYPWTVLMINPPANHSLHCQLQWCVNLGRNNKPADSFLLLQKTLIHQLLNHSTSNIYALSSSISSINTVTHIMQHLLISSCSSAVVLTGA